MYNSKDIIKEVFNNTVNYGIVSNQQDFSRMAGRNKHWYSWVKINQYNPSTEAIITLANSLQNKTKNISSKIIKNNIKTDVQKLYGLIATRTMV
jgi:hypothetical protein